MITHTISGLELAWTLVSVLGLIFVCALLNRSVDDYEFTVKYASTDDLRRYAAITTILIFLGGVVTQFSYVTIGIIAMTQSSPHSHLTAANYATASILLAASIISSMFALGIYNRRVKIVEMLKERENGNGS